MEPERWKTELREAITDPRALLRALNLQDTLAPYDNTDPAFPLKVPRSFLARMRSGDPDDPLLRQVLPVLDEDETVPGFGTDPVGDMAAAGDSGWLHKYEGRSLMITTGACAVHCRYCFRRHFPYADQQLTRSQLDAAVQAIAQRPDVTEIILSGGDPLMLDDHRLDELVTALARLPQIKRLRVHTRVPVVIPSRVTDQLLQLFSGLPQRVVVVVHINHPNEINDELAQATQKLRQCNVDVLNQSVLLRGVNDDANVLIKLSETLHDIGVLPYYLHALDPVAGAAHFNISDEAALAIHQHMRAHLPGYLLPALVRETAGASSKLPVTR